MRDEIKREHWQEFCREFSERNQARPTHLKVFGRIVDGQELSFLPFAGIRYEKVPRVAHLIQIMFVDNTVNRARPVSHTISHVTHLLVKQSPEGGDEALEIEDVNGVKRLLHFETMGALISS